MSDGAVITFLKECYKKNNIFVFADPGDLGDFTVADDDYEPRKKTSSKGSIRSRSTQQVKKA